MRGSRERKKREAVRLAVGTNLRILGKVYLLHRPKTSLRLLVHMPNTQVLDGEEHKSLGVGHKDGVQGTSGTHVLPNAKLAHKLWVTARGKASHNFRRVLNCTVDYFEGVWIVGGGQWGELVGTEGLQRVVERGYVEECV